MNRPPEADPPADRLLLLVLLLLLLFASPVLFLWTDLHSPWYLPYLMWLLTLGLGAWLFHRGGNGES